MSENASLSSFDLDFANDVVAELLAHADVADAKLLKANESEMEIGATLVSGESMGFHIVDTRQYVESIGRYVRVTFTEDWGASGLSGGYGATPAVHGMHVPHMDDTPSDLAQRLVGYIEQMDRIRFT